MWGNAACRLGLVGSLVYGLAWCPLAHANTDDAFSVENPGDPWEGYNRHIHEFNKSLDATLIKPVASGYQQVVPAPVDRGITNFFGNLWDVVIGVNNLLQFKFTNAASDAGRVALNSTVGLLGFIDVASDLNLPKHNEDFGQTLGSWGVGPGPYVVIPLFGPSNLRDYLGLAVDTYTNPMADLHPNSHRYGAYSLEIVDQRADLLGRIDVLQGGTADDYSFIRDTFLQRREFLVHDGNPPLPELEAITP